MFTADNKLRLNVEFYNQQLWAVISYSDQTIYRLYMLNFSLVRFKYLNIFEETQGVCRSLQLLATPFRRIIIICTFALS